MTGESKHKGWGYRHAKHPSANQKANTPAGANAFRERVWGAEKRIGVSVDGTMVYIREEGWKELKVGCTFDIEVFPIKSRFCGSGMRWSRDGIERLIPIRATIMSRCFDTTWQAVHNSPTN